MNSVQATTSETETDENVMTAQGKRYTVITMPIAYAKEYVESSSKFVIANDRSNLLPVFTNFIGSSGETNEEPEAFLKKWIPRLLEYQGRPASLELLFEHEWSIADLNQFMKRALGISE